MRAMAAIGDDPDGSGAQIVFGGKSHGTVESIDGINVAIRVEPAFARIRGQLVRSTGASRMTEGNMSEREWELSRCLQTIRLWLREGWSKEEIVEAIGKLNLWGMKPGDRVTMGRLGPLPAPGPKMKLGDGVRLNMHGIIERFDRDSMLVRIKVDSEWLTGKKRGA